MFTPFAFVKSAAAASLDPNAQAYLDQVIAVGGTVTSTIETAVNTLFVALKDTSSLYTNTLAMYPIVGGTADAHFVEGKQPTSANLTIGWTGSAAIHNSNGITVSGSSVGYGHINTAYNSLFTSVGDCGMGAYQRTVTANNGFLIGKVANTVTNPRMQLNAPFDSVNYGVLGDVSNAVTYTDSNPKGFSFVTRTSTSNQEIYLNGVSQNTNTNTTATGLPTETIELFGADGNINKCITNTNFFIFTKGLSDTQVSDLNTIITNFQTSLSRQAV
jgi:hypothetical protein